jgi:hypothetical protein
MRETLSTLESISASIAPAAGTAEILESIDEHKEERAKEAMAELRGDGQ